MVHWTQKPENKAKMLKVAALGRRSKKNKKSKILPDSKRKQTQIMNRQVLTLINRLDREQLIEIILTLTRKGN